MNDKKEETIMFLGIDMGFWIGIGAVAGITLVGCIVAWALPPKK